MKSVPSLSNMKLPRQIAAFSAMAAVAFLLPVAALADINSTATLSVGQSLSLDTGATNTSGTGDITFTGTSLTFIGSAKGGSLSLIGSGQATFDSLTQAILNSLASFATTAPIPASSLTVGTIVGVGTNGGNAAKLLVTAISSTSISFQYTTYGASSTGPGTPKVTGVTNNYSGIPAGFSNSGVSPSSIIAIYGSNMGAPVVVETLQSSAGPAGLPTTLNGTSVSVTVGGKTLPPLGLYYESPVQINAVLPAATPTGTGTITVTYNNVASNAFSIQVVPSAFGLDTYYGTGTGLIAARDTTGALLDYTHSAAPGEIITLWGSGLGADPQDSDTVFTTSPHAVNQASVQVWIGGAQAAVGYAGSSGYPGLDQINVTIPSGLTGCNVSVVVVVNGVASNFVTAPINQGNGVCSDPVFGITGSQLTSLSGQTTVRSGDVFLGQFIVPNTNGSGTITENLASADFQSVTGSYYGAASGSVSIGSCIVTEVFSTTGIGTVTSTGLDAGTVSLTAPDGSNYTMTTIPTLPGFYSAMLSASAIPSSGGTGTFSWTGGKDVGASSATVVLPNPLLSWTNQSAGATVNRSQGVLVTWTGGAPGTLVYISGSSSSNSANGSFVCYAPQSALQFTVPSYVLDTLPAGKGTLAVENITQYKTFSAPTLDIGIAFGFTGILINNTYQ